VEEIELALTRFGWTEVIRVPALGPCWEWNGSRQNKRGGYGQLWYGEKLWRAHRLAYITWVEPIPHNLHVLHHCDNPPCIRPTHLFVGTDADNAKDKVAKGRSVNPVYSSEDAPAAKLTANDVENIRSLLNDGVSLGEIGRRFHVTKQAIARIKKGQTWTPLKMSP
jgi:hypothetical protein